MMTKIDCHLDQTFWIKWIRFVNIRGNRKGEPKGKDRYYLKKKNYSRDNQCIFLNLHIHSVFVEGWLKLMCMLSVAW